MLQAENTSNISRLTEILAAHGVYALTIIFIFYQQWRAGQNLKAAKPDDHAYFRKVYTSVVTATYALVVISTAVWIYATFIYLPNEYIRGSVSGLTEQVVSPQKEGDPPKVVETIAPESLDIDLYQSKKNGSDVSGEGKYDLGWVLLPRENVHTLVFRFQHRFERIKSTKRLLLNTGSSRNSLEAKRAEKRFTLDLRNNSYSAGSPIELMYEPDPEDPVEKVGKMYLKEPESGNRREIAWDEIKPGTKLAKDQKTSFVFSLPGVVYASSPQPSMFKENGDYDRQLGRVLRERLSSSDLETQLAGRDLLVKNGKRSFKFILDTLNDALKAEDRDELLISNLGSVVVDIESEGNPAPRDIHLTLAEGFADLDDAPSSAEFFDKAGEGSDDRIDLCLRRGAVYYLTKRYTDSIRNLNQYLVKAQEPSGQAVAHNILGASYMRLGRDPEAISHYRTAMRLDPVSDSPYNNLAYLFAERGENLEEALRLVNRALALAKDPDGIAEAKDTKGWILYKQRKFDEALLLVKQAAAEKPNDPEIRGHLKVVQMASLGPSKK